jgi:small GTP-binding protein
MHSSKLIETKSDNVHSKKHERLIKFITIGDSGVGKSCLIFRFANNIFPHSYTSTIGINDRTRTIDYQDITIKLQVFDSLQHSFRPQNQYYHAVDGVLLVYDISDRETFQNIIKVWCGNVKTYGKTDVKCILVGTKSDLRSPLRKVSYQEGSELAKKIGMPFIEVSSKTGVRADEAFSILTNEVLKQKGLAPLPVPFQAIEIKSNPSDKKISPSQMFSHEKKLLFPEKKSSEFIQPIVILDIDETLILGQNKNNFAVATFNHQLIKTLVQAGIKEVYLLTAFELRILRTKWERDEDQQLLRLDLINHLEEKGITVKAIVSNHDIVSSYDKEASELKENTWISRCLSGDYYNNIIKPREKSVNDNPDINLNEDKVYQDVIEQQKKNKVVIDQIISLYKSNNIKSPLADLLFTSLKREGIIFDNKSQTVLFIDDKMHYINAVSEIAKKHEIEIACLQIKNPYEQNYSDFFSKYYPIFSMLEYKNLVLTTNTKLGDIRNQAFHVLTKYSFLGGESKNKNVILTPLNKALEVFSRVKNDMEKNIHDHDYIGACNAMIHELTKRHQELVSNKDKFHLKEQGIVDSITVRFNIAMDELEKLRLQLSSAMIHNNCLVRLG